MSSIPQNPSKSNQQHQVETILDWAARYLEERRAYQQYPQNAREYDEGTLLLDRIRPLIEAAPELLKAFTECLFDLEMHARRSGPGPDRRLEVARVAIAKAEGGA